MMLNDDATQPLEKSSYTIEKATQLTGHGKFQYILLAVAGIASMYMVLENQSMSFALPMAKCDLKLSTGEYGFIQSVVYIGVLVSSHFWGFVTDTWGRVRTLRLTLLLTFVASVVSSLSWNTWMLIVTRLIVGLTTSGIKIAAIVYMSEFFDKKHRTKYLALLSGMTTSANIVQPLLGMLILTSSFEYNWIDGFVYRPWRLYIMAGSLFAGLTGIVLFFMPESPAYSLSMGREQEALYALKTVFHINSGHPKEEYGVKHIEMASENFSNLKRVTNVKGALNLMWNQTWPLFAPPYRANMIVLCVLMFFSFAASQGWQMWYPQILVFFEGRANLSLTTCETIMMAIQPKSMLTPLLNATMVTFNSSATPQPLQRDCSVFFDMNTMNVVLVLGVVLVTLSVTAAFLINIIGKTTVITTWFICNTFAAFGLIWANNYYAIMVLMIFAISTITLINSYITISSDLFETQYKGMATSLLIMSGRIGSIIGSNLVGAMIYTSCGSMFKLIAGTSLGCTIVIYYILRKTERVNNVKGKK